MKTKYQNHFCIAVCLLVSFALWTVAVRLIDVQPIGPQASAVGFATLNGTFHALTGVHWSLYVISDWLSLLPLCVVLWFAAMGLFQWIERKSLLKVDHDILCLGGLYLVVLISYLFFELYVINYRPVLIDGCLEASYPSSTTMLVLCVMSTAAMQANIRIENAIVRRCVTFTIDAFTGFMVIGRLLSGVHWFTDIVGGILLSASLVIYYRAICIRLQETL